jgi:hypothetical protein
VSCAQLGFARHKFFFFFVVFFEILDFVCAVAGSEFVNFCKYK